MRLKTAVASRRVAAIQEKLGHYSQGLSACQRATRLLEGLLAGRPSVPEYQCELAISESTLGRLLWATGPQVEAERLTRRAIPRLEKLAADAPLESQYRHELAKSNLLVSQFFVRTDLRESERALLQAVASLRSWPPTHPRR